MPEHGENGDSEHNGYAQRSAEQNAKYRREYSAWVTSLPPTEREKLRALGLLNADTSYQENESDRDISERNMADKPIESGLFPVDDLARHLWEVVEGIAILIIDAENIRLEADTLAFMAGFYTRMGKSGTELGAKYGLTRAAWSKRCKHLQRKLGLPPSRAMKSEEACKVYQHTNGAMKISCVT